MITYTTGPTDPVRYRSKAVFMALIHTILTMVLFTSVSLKSESLLDSPDGLYPQYSLATFGSILWPLLTALCGLVVYSPAHRHLLLSQPKQLIIELLQTVLIEFVIVMVLTFLFLPMRDSLSSDAVSYLMIYSINSTVITGLSFNQMFFSENVLVVLTHHFSSLISVYSIVLGKHLMNLSRDSTPAPLSKHLRVLVGIVIYEVVLILINTYLFAIRFPSSRSPSLISVFRFFSFMIWIQLSLQLLMLWYIYPTLLGVDVCKQVLVDRHSQYILALLGVFTVFIIPYGRMFLFFHVYTLPFGHLLLFLGLDAMYLIYTGFIFVFQILVVFSIKYGLPHSVEVNLGNVTVQNGN